MAEQKSPEEIAVLMRKLRIVPGIAAIIGVVLAITGSEFTTWFPIICVGIGMFLGWSQITTKMIDNLEKQKEK